MIRNYFKVAIRNITRNKLMSSLNIMGLAIGLSAALVIYLIVQYQYGFDKHYAAADRMYRVVTHMRFAETDFKNGGAPSPVGAVIKQEIPGIEKATAVHHNWYEPTVSLTRPGSEEKTTFKKQVSISFVGEDYTSMFEKKFIAGGAKGMNDVPGLVILTEARARLYYPGIPADKVVGSVMFYNDTIQAKVAGVIEDEKHSTDISYDELLSIPTMKAAGVEDPGNAQNWGSVNSSSEQFITLAPGIKVETVNKQLQAMLDKYKEAQPDVDKTKNFTHLQLQSLSDIHFNQDFGAATEKKSLNGLMILAGFLLLLGCINFINLSTAQAARRAKEIGIRKTVGGTRNELVRQFLTETFSLTVLAGVLAVVLTPVLLKVFKDFVPDGLQFNQEAWFNIVLFVPVLIVIVSILAGFYPALVLSKFKPVLVLKNQAFANTGQSRSAWLRKTLTVSQFIIAQFLVIATIVVGRQIDYSLNMDMGFSKDNVVSLRVPFDYMRPDEKASVLRTELLTIPGIERVSISDLPAISGSMSSTVKYEKNGKEYEVNLQMRNIDTSFLSLFKIKLVAGRNLKLTDSSNITLINESMLKELGYKTAGEVIGKFIGDPKSKREIVGVVKDFNLTSTRSGILPAGLRISKYHSQVNLLLEKENGTGSQKKTLAAVEKAFKSIYADGEFSTSYYDEQIKGFYEKEEKISKLLNWATGLAIFISCLGLLGLAIYTANQRKKEIGIRKVLGASVAQVVNLLSRDFLALVSVACIVAIPLAWWAASNWLEDFPYRAPLNPWIFIAGSGFLLVIAFGILSIKTISSASVNPVKSLRSE